MALGKYSGTSAAVSSNTTTTLVTPGATEQIYLYFLGVDTTVAGTTSTAKVQANGGAVIAGVFATTAVGHQESYPGQGQRDYPGLALGVGKALEVVTAGGAAATGTFTYIYEIKG
jgi:hypothetical protein